MSLSPSRMTEKERRELAARQREAELNREEAAYNSQIKMEKPKWASNPAYDILTRADFAYIESRPDDELYYLQVDEDSPKTGKVIVPFSMKQLKQNPSLLSIILSLLLSMMESFVSEEERTALIQTPIPVPGLQKTETEQLRDFSDYHANHDDIGWNDKNNYIMSDFDQFFFTPWPELPEYKVLMRAYYVAQVSGNFIFDTIIKKQVAEKIGLFKGPNAVNELRKWVGLAPLDKNGNVIESIQQTKPPLSPFRVHPQVLVNAVAPARLGTGLGRSLGLGAASAVVPVASVAPKSTASPMSRYPLISPKQSLLPKLSSSVVPTTPAASSSLSSGSLGRRR